MEDKKQFWKSKTFWLSLCTAVLPLIPQLAPLCTPEVMSAAGVLFGVLRTVSGKPLKLK